MLQLCQLLGTGFLTVSALRHVLTDFADPHFGEPGMQGAIGNVWVPSIQMLVATSDCQVYKELLGTHECQ